MMGARMRRVLVLGITLTFALAIFAIGGSASAAPKRNADPVPIPGGIDIPPLIHVFAPGPTELGLMGEDVEPSTITNFNGLSAYAVFAGGATDADGNAYDAVLDMRIMDGVYVGADGSTHRGTFGFI
jgi:hypothetical protein